MDLELKIGAVFSLATDVPETSTNYSGELEDIGEPGVHAEMTVNSETSVNNNDAINTNETNYITSSADQDMTTDSVMTVNNVPIGTNETDSVMTGADPEMNSSAEVNDLEIDVDGEMSTDSAYSPDHPPVLPMEETVGVLSSVYHDDMVEAMPPPVLSPVTEELSKKSMLEVKREPVEYEG